MLDYRKQYNMNHEVRSIHGFTVPLRLLSDTHDNYIVFTDCFIKTKCYLSFEDEGQFELFKECDFGARTLFIARDITYTVKYNLNIRQYVVSFIKIWKNRGRLDKAKGDPEFKYWIDIFNDCLE